MKGKKIGRANEWMEKKNGSTQHKSKKIIIFVSIELLFE